jgi:hypothetical protein
MKKAALVKACEDLIKSFDPKRVTLDSHADEVLGDCESPEADAQNVFIKQVFYGCVRNKPALKVPYTIFICTNILMLASVQQFIEASQRVGLPLCLFLLTAHHV